MVANLCRGLSSQNPLMACSKNFYLESTIQELPLWNVQFEISGLGYELAETFQANPLIPAVLLIENGEMIGVISRRQFLECMSRPFGLDIFGTRSLKILYQFLPSSISILPGETLIVAAAKIALKRNPEILYEPIVVEIAPQEYRLLDVHELLVAQSLIHELTAKLLQEQTKAILLQTEKMASLGRMVAGIAHEIRNPINCIGGNLPFLSNYYKDLIQLVSVCEQYVNPYDAIQEIKEEIELDFLKKDLPQLLDSLFLSSERLTQIVGSLHSFSHVDESQPQLANIHDCIDSTLLILKNRLKLGIKVLKNYKELPLVKCYSGQLSQVFMNLLSNAIDALLEKSTTKPKDWHPCIEISTKLIEEKSSKIVAVKIADNGVGIPLEIQTKIFETFFTTKPRGKGTGLGLAISYEIITQKHGGQLLVTSQPNVGTEFQVFIPIG